MSVRVMTQVFHASRAKLADRLVLLAIADCADDDGHAWPGLEKIAHKACVSVRTAQRCLRNLEALGELHIELQAGPYTVNRYQILPLRGDNLSPRQIDGVTSTAQRGDSAVTGGATPVSPNPSVIRQESSDLSLPRAREAKLSRKAKPKTPWPDDFALTSERRAYAEKQAVQNPDREWDKFRDRCLRDGARYADWDAAWRNWCRMAVERFGAADPPPQPPLATCVWSVREGHKLRPCGQPVTPTAGQRRLCVEHLALRQRLDQEPHAQAPSSHHPRDAPTTSDATRALTEMGIHAPLDRTM